jgi:acyl-CoA synthetase (AMP-forming)/AMP-acid ligase II
VAATTPDKAAVIMAESGETMTYAELDDMANRLANWLRSIGLERGDHAAFCLENRLEFLAVMWGCHYAGLYYTAISSRLNNEELAYIVNNSGSGAFITSAAQAESSEAILDATPGVRARLSIGHVAGHDDFHDVLSQQDPTPLADRLESNDMLYSSGTTGHPKGVKTPAPDVPLGTGESVLSLGQMLFGYREDAVYLSPGPLYHAAPMRFCRAMLRQGGTVVVMEKYDSAAALGHIERYRVTTSQWVPTMFVRMLKLDEEIRTAHDLSSLECAIHAAAPCPVEVKEAMINWWGPVLHEYYAGTEGNGFVYCNSDEWMAHKGTVGRPITSVLHIVDDDGNEVPTGETGGVYFSDGSDFEYHDDPEKTASSHLPNGWSTLGDIGRVDEDGFLYLTDRKAFMIISGGVNIYPQEAENALTMHPDVFDVAVFGIPNEDFGEEVKAVVQPVQMPQNDEEAGLLERQLIAFCRERLADVKCPRSIDFRPELPRHPTGKLYKRLLKDEYAKASG